MRQLIQSLVLMVLALVGVISPRVSSAEEPVQIVAVNYPLAYFADRILGDAAEVRFPVPRDIDPSFWRPLIAEISAIQSADLILLNGASFATWVDRVSLPRSKIVITSVGFADRYIATESITHSHGDGGEHSHEGTASYTWLNPLHAIAQAEAIAAAAINRGLVEEDGAERRLSELRAELEALDSAVRAAFETAPQMAFIATHPRYHYVAEAYDAAIASLEWDAGAAPTEAELADLAALMAETDAKVLIWEAAPPDAALAATQALGLRNVVFPPLAHAVDGADFVEALSAGLLALPDASGLTD